jgi:putative tryptophan/tyrosine transport system substrate-binding protein
MQRWTFLALLGGAIIAWTTGTSAQQSERVPLIAVLQVGAGNEPQAARNLALFRSELQKLGWTEGKNVRLDVRQSPGDVAGLRQFAKELVELKPDVIVANSTPAATALAKETTTVPIVFINIVDPVAIRLVASLDHPGGNLTGVVGFQSEIAAKWVETLAEIAPRTSRMAVIFNPATNAETWQTHMRAARSAATSRKIEILEAPIDKAEDIERTIGAYANDPPAGLIVVPSTFAFANRQRIVDAAANNYIPAVYGISPMVRTGGLISHGPDVQAQWGVAASPVNKILRGAKPGDVPVVLSDKLSIAINLKTAKSLGITVPTTLLARADEVVD